MSDLLDAVDQAQRALQLVRDLASPERVNPPSSQEPEAFGMPSGVRERLEAQRGKLSGFDGDYRQPGGPYALTGTVEPWPFESKSGNIESGMIQVNDKNVRCLFRPDGITKGRVSYCKGKDAEELRASCNADGAANRISCEITLGGSDGKGYPYVWLNKVENLNFGGA